MLAPGSLAANSLSTTAIEVTWTDTSSNETVFDLEHRIDGEFQAVATLGANVTRHVDSGLASGTTYTYRVRSRNTVGSSDWVSTAPATTRGEVPPTGLTANPRSASEVELHWSDNSSGESGFTIEARSTGSFQPVLSVPEDTTTAALPGLEAQTRYRFRVQATGGTGDSTYSNEATATTFQADPEPCVEAPRTLCLNSGRFSVEVTWRDFAEAEGQATVVPSTASDSGLLWFFDAENWEMLIKILDGCGLNDRFWVFAAATTDVEYSLRVTDSYTGFTRTYTNPLGNAAAATTDTDAFATCAATRPPSFPRMPAENKTEPPETQAVTLPSVCDDDPDRLCLNRGRFEVSAQWQDFSGNTGGGHVVPLGSPDSGLFWFFSDTNWEVLVKVLDGCGLNDRFWVFAAATTDVQYTLRVHDTVSGVAREYVNPLGAAADAITDTDAFATCP